MNFSNLAEIDTRSGYQQAPNIPANTGKPIEYAGSTTGPGYNGWITLAGVMERPSEVAKLDIGSVARWCEGNVFNDHAHGVRNLVVNTKLLSPIEH